MKEHKINKLDGFIKGWYIDKSICKKLIKLFEENKEKHVNGLFGEGYVPEAKKSTDLHIYNNNPIYSFYFKSLNNCLKKYKNLFPELDTTLSYWGMTEQVNIQKYKPKEGFFKWHAEESNIESSKRMLVFMTYLNTVKDKGETEWLYQKLKIKAEEGLTIIWPANWNFIHKGCISNTETKYIITGWYEFIK
jgi:prolyl 4-hydroxylase